MNCSAASIRCAAGVRSAVSFSSQEEGHCAPRASQAATGGIGLLFTRPFVVTVCSRKRFFP